MNQSYFYILRAINKCRSKMKKTLQKLLSECNGAKDDFLFKIEQTEDFTNCSIFDEGNGWLTLFCDGHACLDERGKFTETWGKIEMKCRLDKIVSFHFTPCYLDGLPLEDYT